MRHRQRIVRMRTTRLDHLSVYVSDKNVVKLTNEITRSKLGKLADNVELYKQMIRITHRALCESLQGRQTTCVRLTNAPGNHAVPSI